MTLIRSILYTVAKFVAVYIRAESILQPEIFYKIYSH